MTCAKIVATLGPATNTLENIKSLLLNGVNIIRINMSHASHDAAKATIETVRAAADELHLHIPIFMDLQGPKIRVGTIKNGETPLIQGEMTTIASATLEGDSSSFSVDYPQMIQSCAAGTTILLDDGKIELTVVEQKRDTLRCKIVKGGIIKSHKGVALPGVAVDLPALTDQDIKDVQAGISFNVDGFFLSFVQSPDDIIELHGVMRSDGKKVPVIAKIEAATALENLEQITAISDGILVARGDLGVEIPLWKIPRIQLHIIEIAKKYRKPVIVATEMLESMIENSRPTRAEVSDVTFAVYSGCDAVMLSAETAVGKYPTEAVSFMRKIIDESEQNTPVVQKEQETNGKMSESVAIATVKMASDIKANAIIVQTDSGYTAQILSHFSKGIPIHSFTHDRHTARVINLHRGVIPHYIVKTDTFDIFIEEATKQLVSNAILQKSASVVAVNITGSKSSMQNANAIRVFHI
ncbi:pyruvate kinase [bacterium]|nr:pyruvate kinase [bacterium]